MAHPPRRPPIYGLLAEFRTPAEIVAAATKVREKGYRKVDGYSPYPMEELSHALGFDKSHLPKIVLGGGILGAIAGYGLQYWASVIEYPMNVGGRPFHSWPAFIPATFETTILFAAFGAVLGMLALNGLPEPYHPVFNVDRFAFATRDRFFLCVEAVDPLFDREQTWAFLMSIGAQSVAEVEH